MLSWTYVTAGIQTFMIVIGAAFGAYCGIWITPRRGRARLKRALVMVIVAGALVHVIAQGMGGGWPEGFEAARQPAIAATLASMVVAGAMLGAHIKASGMSRKRRVCTEVALLSIVIAGACVIAQGANGGLHGAGDAQSLILAGASGAMAVGGIWLGAHYAALAKKRSWMPAALVVLIFVVALAHVSAHGLDVGGDEDGEFIRLAAIAALTAILVVAGAMLGGHYSAHAREISRLTRRRQSRPGWRARADAGSPGRPLATGDAPSAPRRPSCLP